MDLNDLHPPDDYSHRFFIWYEWLQANGPLTNENVFEYFATSMFYDKQSNNQVLRMQTMHTGIPLVNEAEELRRFTGIEFALVHSQPPSLFIIQKRDRISPDEGTVVMSYTYARAQQLLGVVRPLASYFVMHDRIYQSPDVYTLISNRLLTSLHSLQTSLDTLRRHRPAYTPRTGYTWPIIEATPSEDTKKRTLENDTKSPVDSQESEGTPKRKLTSPSGSGRKRQNNMLLFNAMRTTAVHARQAFTLPTGVPDGLIPETPAAGTGARSSPTPAPVPQRAATPRAASNAPTLQDVPPNRGLPGAGKKKKKRTSIAPLPG